MTIWVFDKSISELLEGKTNIVVMFILIYLLNIEELKKQQLNHKSIKTDNVTSFGYK